MPTALCLERCEETYSSDHRLIYPHSTHTHTMSKCAASGTLNTHAMLRALPVFSLKNSRKHPSFEAFKKPECAFQRLTALGLKLLWPIWIQLEPHYRSVHILSLWACKTFCLYYNAPQNGLLAVIGSLANLQIMNKINSVCIHAPRHSVLSYMG